eukprot:6156478-Ditylum_brightwellii.AAC.1
MEQQVVPDASYDDSPKIEGTINLHGIWLMINHCLDLYDRGKVNQLVNDITTAIYRQKISNQWLEMEEHVTKTFVSMPFQRQTLPGSLVTHWSGKRWPAIYLEHAHKDGPLHHKYTSVRSSRPNWISPT